MAFFLSFLLILSITIKSLIEFKQKKKKFIYLIIIFRLISLENKNGKLTYVPS